MEFPSEQEESAEEEEEEQDEEDSTPTLHWARCLQGVLLVAAAAAGTASLGIGTGDGCWTAAAAAPLLGTVFGVAHIQGWERISSSLMRDCGVRVRQRRMRSWISGNRGEI